MPFFPWKLPPPYNIKNLLFTSPFFHILMSAAKKKKNYVFSCLHIHTGKFFPDTHTTKFLQFFSYDSNAKKQSRSPNLMICKNSYSNSLSKNYCEKKYLKKNTIPWWEIWKVYKYAPRVYFWCLLNLMNEPCDEDEMKLKSDTKQNLSVNKKY